MDGDITIDTEPGIITVKIGVLQAMDFNVFGQSALTYGSGIGSYATNDAFCSVFSNNFSEHSEFQGDNATVTRIAQAIANTASHEAGHVLGLFHAYGYDSFDPTFPGALQANNAPQEPPDLPGDIKADDPDFKSHLMSMVGSGYVLPGDLATINQEFSVVSHSIISFAKVGGGTIPDNMVWGMTSETWTQLENITVSANKTLFIIDNATIKAANSKRLYVYGKLDATSVTFTSSSASPTKGIWGGIYLQNGATHASEISQCTIQYPYYGVYIHNSLSHSISNTTISNCTYGIYGDAGGQTTLSNVTVDLCDYGGIKLVSNSNPIIFNTSVKNTYYAGMYLDGSSPRMWESDIFDNNQNGIYMTNQSRPNLAYSSYQVGNVIKDNGNHEVLIDYSFPLLGSNAYNPYQTQNQITDNADYLVYLAAGSDVDAYMVWWGTNPPNVNRFYLAPGTTLNYNPWGTYSIGKNTGGEPVSLSAFERGRRLLSEEKYEEGIAILRQEIEDHPESRSAYRSLLELFALSGIGKYDDYAGNFLEYLASLSEKENTLQRPALTFAAVELANRGYYGDASGVYDYLLSDESNLTPYLINQAFTYYLFHLMDTKRAGELLAILRDTKASEYVMMMAEHDFQYISDNPHHFTGEMKSTGLFNAAKYTAQKTTEAASIPEEYDLSAAYPNPFNPSTTISFDMPEAAIVRISIYNVLGQRVAELVNGNLPTGSHQRVWDAARFSSGIYLVRMDAKDFSKTMKVTLLK